MKKILIIGNSGSGKSWLSKQLSRKLQLQEVNLDSIVWELGGYNQKRSPEAIENEIASIKSQCSWVVEGVFGALAEQLISSADMLLFLDLEWSECESSLYARGSESSKQLNEEQAEKNFRELLKWASEYSVRESKSSRQFHQQLFSDFHGTKICFTTRSQVNTFVAETTC
ncbi:ATPase AAA [Vibrio parahaemolyticus]|nr:ATPase AAA [Vibrio parahaemolyticus]EJM7849366.1 AAA family ATPase [Vibrio parahaemolyticus]PLR57504.1 AAA family ATPase [Vibrio parahaemolyticus]HAV1399850.1 AAA family ATPase [Vibrio parahaemolyticus]HBC3412389.1 AAA family ATPase [Vibrio parahaemolyticus]HBI3715945.1 AAA family ATPase [Vibrio parahaemolyticus]